MNTRSFIIASILLVGLSALAVAAWISADTSPDIDEMPRSVVNNVSANGGAAPELTGGKWINSKPLTLAELKGRVVYLEFWTFGCSNCINTLPTVKRFDATYRDKGLTVIGIETPEFDYEKDFNNLSAAVKKRGIEYPVLTDNESKNWEAYRVNAWPTIVIIDKQGVERYRHIGEGAYAEQERVIKELLDEEVTN